jgi:hypothetical protein
MRRALVLIGASPLLAGAGTCGILFDLWSWEEITEHTDRVVMDVEEGAQSIAGYPRTGVRFQRHVYAYEASLGHADYFVEDGVFNVTFDCDGPATCFADHWLEVPDTLPIEIDLGSGTIAMIGLAGPVHMTLGSGAVGGDDLSVPDLELQGDDVEDVKLRWIVQPQRVVVDVGSGAVLVTLPAGSYACDLDGDATVAPEIVCDPAATSTLSVHVEQGDVTIATAP